MARQNGAFYIIVAVLALGLVFLGLITTFAYQQPTELTQTTGTVKEYRCYEEKWYDDFLGNSKGSYFTVRFEDGSYFEATGICHDLINHSLLEELQVGEEITLTHDPVSGGLEKIYAIEYNGKEYLSADDVFASFAEARKWAHIAGPILFAIGFLTLVGTYVLLFIKIKEKRIKFQNR